MLSRIAILDGARIPFQLSGTLYKKLMSYDLLNGCIDGLLKRNENLKDKVDLVTVGTVMQEVKTSNLARESAIKCGLSSNIPAHTISQACISSARAVCSGAESILSGSSSLVLAAVCVPFLPKAGLSLVISSIFKLPLILFSFFVPIKVMTSSS